MSGLMNKVKSAIHGDKHHETQPQNTQDTQYENTASSNTGYHDSNLANKADPRIDSNTSRPGNFDSNVPSVTGTGRSNNYEDTTSGHEKTYDSNTSGYGNTQRHEGLTDTHGDGRQYQAPKGSALNSHPEQSSDYGPHSSNMMNKADPRVDSDNSRQNQGYGTTGSNQPGNKLSDYDKSEQTVTGRTQSGRDTGFMQSGYAPAHENTTYGSDNTSSNTAGPHKSGMMNKLDPRVDSDRDGKPSHRQQEPQSSSIMGMHSDYPQQNQAYSNQTSSPTHRTTTTTTTNTNMNTSSSGPHKSGLMNKTDPRVDSDNSRAAGVAGYGKDQYGNTNTGRDQFSSDQYDSTNTGRHHGNTDQYGTTDTGGHHRTAGEYGTAGAAAGAAAAAGHHRESNKLHKKDDPRGYDQGYDSNRNTTGSAYDHNQGTTGGAYAGATTGREESREERREEKRERKEERQEEKRERKEERREEKREERDGTTAGPHKSSLMNKLDPRVDSTKTSDEGYGSGAYATDTSRRNEGYNQPSTTGGHHNTIPERRHEGYGDNDNNNASSGYGQSRPQDQGYGNQGYNYSAPGRQHDVLPTRTHDNLDSTRAENFGNTRTDAPYGAPGTTGTGTGGVSRKAVGGRNDYDDDEDTNNYECRNCGHHNTHFRKNKNNNKANVGSELTPGSGRTADTTGPHNSSLMNKLDPRVDNNTRGGQNYGGNTTY